MKVNLPKGLYTALITPFKNGKVDYSSLETLLSFQINAGVIGVVLFGTTGESATLEPQEKYEIIKFAVNFAKGRLKIIAGSGTNNTAHSAKLTSELSKLNPDGFLVVSPYYNKANRQGLLMHFQEIARATDLPIILYNVPGRTGQNMQDDVIAELAQTKNIIGLKDATGDLARVPSLRAKVGKEFLLLSGEDATAVAFNASGGDGLISVTSNIAPKLVGDLQKLSLDRGNFEEALKLQERVFAITSALFLEVNPIPVKYSCFLLKMCENEYRLPLCEPSQKVKEELKEIIKLLA